jgi:hypothetical protein
MFKMAVVLTRHPGAQYAPFPERAAARSTAQRIMSATFVDAGESVSRSS